MSHISKCPKVTDVLIYWEASGKVSELSYKSLLYFSSVGSYCMMVIMVILMIMMKKMTRKHTNIMTFQ